MACSTSEIVFWTVGGLVLIVLIAIGVAEMVRKWGKSSCTDGDCGDASYDAPGDGARAAVVAQVMKENDEDDGVSGEEGSDSASGKQALRAARMTSTQDAFAPLTSSSDEPVEKAEQQYIAEMFDDVFGSSDGVEHNVTQHKSVNDPEFKQLVTKSQTRRLTSSDFQYKDDASNGLARQLGFSTSTINEIRGCNNRKTTQIQSGTPAVAFNATDAYVSQKNSM